MIFSLQISMFQNFVVDGNVNSVLKNLEKNVKIKLSQCISCYSHVPSGLKIKQKLLIEKSSLVL